MSKETLYIRLPDVWYGDSERNHPLGGRILNFMTEDGEVDKVALSADIKSIFDEDSLNGQNGISVKELTDEYLNAGMDRDCREFIAKIRQDLKNKYEQVEGKVMHHFYKKTPTGKLSCHVVLPGNSTGKDDGRIDRNQRINKAIAKLESARHIAQILIDPNGVYKNDIDSVDRVLDHTLKSSIETLKFVMAEQPNSNSTSNNT